MEDFFSKNLNRVGAGLQEDIVDNASERQVFDRESDFQAHMAKEMTGEKPPAPVLKNSLTDDKN